jgi:hypothetical protein
MEVTLPYVVAPSMFHDLYVDLFGGDQDLEAYKLTQGRDNTSLVVGRALWALSRKVKADPELTMLISEADATHVKRMLSHSEKHSKFIADIEEFLGKYGMRSDTVIEMSDPSWVEEPKTAIELLKNYLSDSAVDPDIHWREMTNEREKLVSASRRTNHKLVAGPAGAAPASESVPEGGKEVRRSWRDRRSVRYLVSGI